MKHLVWTTGDAVLDLIPDGKEHYLKCPGGAPANVAVGISRLEGKTAFFGRVGDDPFGYFMRDVLLAEQVDITHLGFDKNNHTSTVLVDLDAQGERTFTFMVNPSADQFISQHDVPKFQEYQWLHACSNALANEPSRSSTLTAMTQAKESGGYVSFDPNLRQDVWQNPLEMRSIVMQAIMLADVVKFSEEEITFLTQTDSIEKAITALSSVSIPVIIITLGAKGALIYYENEAIHVEGQFVDHVVDTTGAGDAFVAGLLAHLSSYDNWCNKNIIINAVKWGNGCGALAVTKKGAMSALPNLSQLKQWLIQH